MAARPAAARQSFADFSREAFEMAVLPVREDWSQAWRTLSAQIDPNADADEMSARRLAEASPPI
ncbi:hypothetical protein ACFSOZ_07965 [Mesorhizobium newzealandense]|uniref:Uncharacterized protein n=1 Tax=Mesorhizobium newzealandense TaxID=1300302 RepID=A0ABW4U952_9HYPH